MEWEMREGWSGRGERDGVGEERGDGVGEERGMEWERRERMDME